MSLRGFLEKKSSEFVWSSSTDFPLFSSWVCDSRQVKPGSFFLSLSQGPESMAHREEAAQRGAKLIGGVPHERLEELKKNYPSVIWMTHSHPRRVWAWVASFLYPQQPSVIVAVTGTNGKTSVASFTRQIWSSLGHKAASLGTVGVCPEELAKDLPVSLRESLSLTTPSPLELHHCLEELAHRAVTHVALEASSHGLHQERLSGVTLAGAGFTNLTQDHLDYHGSFEAYLEAKSLLFRQILPQGGSAVLNGDQPSYSFLAQVCKERCQRLLSYSTKGQKKADLRLLDQSSSLLSLEVMGKAYSVPFPLVGRFQIENALCALGLVLGTGAPEEEAVKALSSLRGEAGRLEWMGTTSSGGQVFVDYAHTPDGLERILEVLRGVLGHGDLWVVFGCGGNRDQGKREIMGRIAAERADHVIVTDDNPRWEEPASIRAQILRGCPSGHEIAERQEAIKWALQNLREGDVLVIAGKGHETGQIVGDQVLPFNERLFIQQILGKRSS